MQLLLFLGGVEEEDYEAFHDVSEHVLGLLVLLDQRLERWRGGDEQLDKAKALLEALVVVLRVQHQDSPHENLTARPLALLNN